MEKLHAGLLKYALYAVCTMQYAFVLGIAGLNATTRTFTNFITSMKERNNCEVALCFFLIFYSGTTIVYSERINSIFCRF